MKDNEKLQRKGELQTRLEERGPTPLERVHRCNRGLPMK
jgi:hypothetical protein